ncbi:DMT family transporter [Amycolatopsis sp. DSM 110486]|uniref:DMT family transporter n=1 Tax=Amycolatopsis sp. DSM 110486 TaxID=2865832 RepID=UPI001C69A8BA|nr:DMT family transporter [Amycolatopsis sp. DSM 110486]QYN20536.1 DMT family transporter [Amycolatopsis sp. DSM 110486]
MSTSKPVLAIGGTVVLWASAFPSIRVGLDGYGPLGLSLARLVVASVALAVAAPFLGVRLPRRKDLPLIALCGLTGMAAYQVLLNWGEVHVPAGTASLLVATAPVFSAVLAAAFLGERLGARGILGSAVALGGSALIALSGGDVQYSTAAWVVLAAALVQGAYHFCSKPLLRHYSGLEVACYAMWTGTLFSLPLAPAAWHGLETAPTSAQAAVLYLGLLPSALGFVLWGYGVARNTVTAATSALYLVPVVALAVAYVWLGEVPAPVELAGGAIAVGGVVLITARRKTRRGSATAPVQEPVAESR